MRSLMYVAFGALTLLGPPLAQASEASDRELEAKLLSGSLSLRGVMSYSRTQHDWKPLPDGRAPVRLVNLWSKTCVPCLAELPELKALAEEWQRSDRQGVQFLFIADPPDQTSRQEVEAFWTSPYADSLAKGCPTGAGVVLGTNPATRQPSCLLTVPEQDPARSETEELQRSLGDATTRPLTLLLDPQGTIRQVFVGSLRGKRVLGSAAISRLRQAVSKPPGGPRLRAATR